MNTAAPLDVAIQRVHRRNRTRAEFSERVIETILFCFGFFSIFITAGIVIVLAFEAAQFFREVSLTSFFTDTQWTPLFSDAHFGIAPLLCGTFLTTFIALIVALPMGVTVALYLSEYASSRRRAVLKPVLEVLAGIPTIVYGYFALLFVTPLLRKIIPELAGFNALSPGIVMGIMIVPMVASLSEDALHAVPTSLREGAYALGSTRLQMIFRVLVPAALGGVTAAFILAMSRAVGETMIVTIAAGQQPILTLNPLSSVETMTAYIVQISLGDVPHGTREYRTLFAVASLLFVLTFILNTVSIKIRERFKSVFH
jgi:phosphate transport system permease protein